MISIPLETQIVVAIQLLLAAFLSMILGWERERKHREAGLRTHMLIGTGSCLFTALSLYGFADGDPGRVASQILPGLGFLGAGAILKEGANIQGLTTAASIWLTAAVGMAVATGAWFLAICAVLLVWFVLSIMQRIKPELRKQDGNE
ncbi:MAG TPA: MgtC/SapB family protein [Oceanobacillus sp.]|jgi:putative Mg2+ transporter-C (MgtC) family protein|nr:MgtC/SapB family protein [Oceanobacillus sp.]